MLRQLREDAREFPATAVLSGLWVLVFVLMVVNRLVAGSGLTADEFFLGLRGGHRFGDMTLGDLFAGEIWRTVTATFVHYGLLHIGMNLYALYQLGCLVESWYGPGPFVAIYVLTGGVGNLLSAGVRSALRWSPTVSSAGGSVVVMGLVGLCAVVGWRSRTRLGRYLRNQMILVIALTAGLGLLLSLFGLPVIDNWGHACGAFVGALIGLANETLTRQAGRWPSKLAGALGVLVLVASAGAQVVDDREETVRRRREAEQALQRMADDDRRLFRLEEVRQLYITVALPRRIVRTSRVVARPKPGPAEPEQELFHDVVRATLRAFESMATPLGRGPTSADYERVRQLLKSSLDDPLTAEELREFDERTRSLMVSQAIDREFARRQSQAHYEGNR